jgi:ribosomal protein S18 acetylase RimI-like enzyme
MSDSPKPAVSLLFPDQYGEAAAVLGRAFANDPLIRAIVAPLDDSEAVPRMTGFFNVVMRAQRKDGQPVLGVVTEGRVAAVAVIEHVRRPSSSAGTIFHGLPLLPELMRAVGWKGIIRTISTLDTLTRNRPSEPHIYLNDLGVEPALQGRHFGVAILDFLKEQAALRADFAGVYLETATENNVSYYSRAGYRVMNEIYPLGVRVWRMLQPT